MDVALEDDILITLVSEAESEMSYFNDLYVLGSQRVRQMTRTYNDAEAVSRLLLDREKDLELAAKIGKTLLERNHELQQTNEMLEEQLNNANDQVTQLKHDLQQKVNLLQMVTDEEYDRSSAQCDDLSSLTDLQKKLKLLEEENSNLKLEANHLKSLTESLEEREQQLINDCVRQLSESSAQLGAVSTQLNDKTDALMKQQNQIMNLLAEVNQLHQNEAKLCADAEELRCSLYAARETQAELSQELIDVQERYAEVLNLLSEARDEIRNLSEQKDIKSATSSNIDSLFGSLASELEASVGSHGGQRQFFEGENLGDSLLDPRSAVAAPSQAVLKFESAATAVPQDPQSLRDLSSESPKRAYDCAYGSSTSLAICLEPTVQPVCSVQPPRLGVPGRPGTNDLENAIQRLTLRRQAELLYRQRMFGRYLRSELLTSSKGDSQLLSCSLSALGHSAFAPSSSSPVSGTSAPLSSALIHSPKRRTNGSRLFDGSRFLCMIHNWFMPNANRLLTDTYHGHEIENVASSCCSFTDSLVGSEGLDQRPFTLCSAACFVNTVGTYSYVNSRVLHPNVPFLPHTEEHACREDSSQSNLDIKSGQQYPCRSMLWNLELRHTTNFTWAASSIVDHDHFNEGADLVELSGENVAHTGHSIIVNPPQSSSTSLS
uniref:HAP1 N-terminal domain-containing protein n=1 Tax=Trichuris muris TaxID=70415 RepID=A0A5S6QDY3_TRIMR